MPGRVEIERLRTGVPGFDRLIAGGIPRGFFVAVVGEPGTGKTVFCIHYAYQGYLEGDKVIYVTTEESRESIVRQAEVLGMRMSEAVASGRVIIIDALMREKWDEWSLQEVTIDELIEKIIAAKKKLGRGRARLVVDSMSAFWLDKPAMARKYSYTFKRVMYKWGFTALLTSQYAITTQSAFGWGLEHVADGIIRFRRRITQGRLERMVLVEKMRQTPHSLYLHRVSIIDGRGMRIEGPLGMRAEDTALPSEVQERIRRASQEYLGE